MSWIQNCSAHAITIGNHRNPGIDGVLIQIGEFPTSYYPFKTIHQFDFLDLEESDGYEDQKITDEQAAGIILALQNALERDENVVVNCTVGLCRSGAIAEVGIMMGFDDTGVHRIPNLLVKKKLLTSLGWYGAYNE
jgi:rhodanese-related sulfurtransferase